ncbi:MAG: hypothetical protein ACM3X7_04530 [Solirubrobacterales bacterium]
MSKEKGTKLKNSSFLPILFMIIGGMCSFFGIRIIDSSLRGMGWNNGNRFISIVIMITFMYLATYIQIIVHEGGHLICGIISGYKFVSFRIGSLMIIFNGSNYKIKKFNIKGTGGQCLMMPPGSDSDNFPYVLFNLGGIIANTVFSLLCLLIYKLLPQVNLFSVFLIILFIIGITFALINGIPMYLGGIPNDGKNALFLGKDKVTKNAFWLQLYNNGLIANGTRLTDISEELFQMSDQADLNNPLICTLGVFKFSYLHDKRLFDEAKEMGEYLLVNAPGILEIHKNELRCELLFYEIMGSCRKEEIERLYTPQLINYIKATSSYVSRKRLIYAYALLVEGNVSKAKNELKKFEQTAKTYPYEVEVQAERELLAMIDGKWIQLSNGS